MNTKLPYWQIWIDTGGTFTDCVAFDPQGNLYRAKVLSSGALRGIIEQQLDANRLKVKSNWSALDNFIQGFQFRFLHLDTPPNMVARYEACTQIISLANPLNQEIPPGTAFEAIGREEAPILAARLVTHTPANSTLPPIAMRLATTRGTNALLEHRGAKLALFMTEGFGDLLLIGTQQRPDLFAFDIQKPEPLYEEVVEVPERIDANGAVLRPLQLDSLGEKVQQLAAKGIKVAAVAFLHSYQNPDHEKRLEKFLLQNGFCHVSCSSDLASFIKILPRAETAIVDAYLSPIINLYLKNVSSHLPGGTLHVMTSAGGLVQPQDFRARDSLLSGPAGGVAGAALAGKRSGFQKTIAFDMGGTSTDVSRFDGDFEYVFEYEIGEAHLVAPALAIETVAAGGGSICWFDGARLRVGPQSAGATPGPACYGAGGPLTLTDVNLLLGRLQASRFEIPISHQQAEERFDPIYQEVIQKTGEKPAREAILEGYIEIANERMADAIRRISIRKGYDAKNYALVAFGGAGGQHACGVASRLGMKTVLIPEDASLLSAFGLGQSAIERFAEMQILQPLPNCNDKIPAWMNALSEKAIKAVQSEGIPAQQIEIRRKMINLRFIGQDFSLSIEYDKPISLSQVFENQYKSMYGHWPENRAIEIESIRVVASSSQALSLHPRQKVKVHKMGSDRFTSAYLAGQWQKVAYYEREALWPGATFSGPALIFEQHSTAVIEEGWLVLVDGAGALNITQNEV